MIADGAVVLVGLLIGLLVGATGVGAGTLGAPFLIFLLKVDPFVAVGTDLFMSAIMKAAGSILHKRSGNIEWSSFVPLAISGIIGSIVGLGIVAFLKLHGDVHAARNGMRHVIGIVLFFCALAIAFSSRLRASHQGFDRPVYLSIVGSTVAAVTAVTGVGVGSLSVPALYFLKGRTQTPVIVGTSLAYAAIVTAVGAVGQISLGDVDYGLGTLLLVGALPGVTLGSALVTRAPAMLKPVIAVLLVISGVRLFA